jgi:hypothetical protein
VSAPASGAGFKVFQKNIFKREKKKPKKKKTEICFIQVSDAVGQGFLKKNFTR